MAAKSKKNDVKVETATVKEEKDEVFPLTHYVDDRVELVKQIFSALKTKTIRNLAPDFLKKSNINEIEELCLNELLRLSTKRLNSIINSTKCPSDTESSDDSDVRNVEEHISLEEISSDSETERNRNKSKSGKAKKGTTNKQGESTNAKGCSVLELLELQARARAIRSQLALEPVAKIEVTSDDSSETGSDIEKPKSTTTKPPIANNEVVKSSSHSEKPVNGSASTSTNRKCKRIKLKRNFRKHCQDDGTDKDHQSDNEQQDGYIAGQEVSEKAKDENKNPAQNRDRETERSPSPDVITILPSPETMCISDSSDEEKNLPSSSLQRQVGKIQVDHDEDKRDSVQDDDIEPKPKEPEEIEDGEIVDQEEGVKCLEKKEPDAKDAENSNKADQEMTESLQEDLKKQLPRAEPSESDTLQQNLPESESSPLQSAEDAENDPKANTSADSENAENEPADCGASNHNDDVISLGHDDLDDEMHNEPDEDPSTTTEAHRSPKLNENNSNEPIDEDIINLDDSSDDELPLKKSDDQSQSWNYRWLKSDRVSKILATSRLGNRVRDKIKKSKKLEEKLQEEEEVVAPVAKVFESQFEDGSIQQYAEILEREKSKV